MEALKSGPKSSASHIGFKVEDGKLTKLRIKTGNSQIDTQLIRKSFENEVAYLKKAKEAGVSVPEVFNVDDKEMAIQMEYLTDKISVKDFMNQEGTDKEKGSLNHHQFVSYLRRSGSRLVPCTTQVCFTERLTSAVSSLTPSSISRKTTSTWLASALPLKSTRWTTWPST